MLMNIFLFFMSCLASRGLKLAHLSEIALKYTSLAIRRLNSITLSKPQNCQGCGDQVIQPTFINISCAPQSWCTEHSEFTAQRSSPKPSLKICTQQKCCICLVWRKPIWVSSIPVDTKSLVMVLMDIGRSGFSHQGSLSLMKKLATSSHTSAVSEQRNAHCLSLFPLHKYYVSQVFPACKCIESVAAWLGMQTSQWSVSTSLNDWCCFTYAIESRSGLRSSFPLHFLREIVVNPIQCRGYSPSTPVITHLHPSFEAQMRWEVKFLQG